MVGILAEVAIYLLPLAAVTKFYPLGSTPCVFIRQFVNKEVLESIFNGPNWMWLCEVWPEVALNETTHTCFTKKHCGWADESDPGLLHLRWLYYWLSSSFLSTRGLFSCQMTPVTVSQWRKKKTLNSRRLFINGAVKSTGPALQVPNSVQFNLRTGKGKHILNHWLKLEIKAQVQIQINNAVF